jgi:hypothetical protein
MDLRLIPLMLCFVYLMLGASIGCLGYWLMPRDPPLQHGWARILAGMGIGVLLVQFAAGMIPGRGGSPFFSGLVATVIALGWVFVRFHRPILSWYYHLTPHPAADAVDQATLQGQPLDAAAVASLAGLPSTGDPTRDAVLAAQARALAERWRAHEATLVKAETRLMAEEAERLRQDNLLAVAQTELAKAALAHEIQAARVAELERQRGDHE